MSRDLPSFTGLRAFEAVARNMSFRAAADELHVSHSAISHHVRALESRLGVRLLNRTTRRVALTDEGARYYPVLKEAFDRMERGTAELLDSRLAGVLTVQVYVTTAMQWLLPRLSRYQALQSDVEVRLSTAFQEWEFNPDGVDVGIVLGEDDDPRLHFRYLYTGKVTPVCSPALTVGERGLHQPADIARFPVIDVYTSPRDWQRWLEAVALGDLAVRITTRYDTYLMAMQAAAAGNGIAMAEEQDAEEEVRAGRLIRPFDIAVPRVRSWYTVCEASRRDEPKIKSFMDWVEAEMAERRT